MDIAVSHVTKRFGSTTALDDVSFELEPGEVVGVLGANGAGKTTLLNVMAGVFIPDGGEIRYDGERFRRDRLDLRRRFFYLPDRRRGLSDSFAVTAVLFAGVDRSALAAHDAFSQSGAARLARSDGERCGLATAP